MFLVIKQIQSSPLKALPGVISQNQENLLNFILFVIQGFF